MKMKAICSSEMSVNARFTQLQIPEDNILHSHCCENLKSYTTRLQKLQIKPTEMISGAGNAIFYSQMIGVLFCKLCKLEN
jgi:hypothetical protein